MHRKYWALCKLICDEFRELYRCGGSGFGYQVPDGPYRPVAITSTGEVLQVPRSISYAMMDQIEFDAYWQRVIKAVVEHLLPGLSLREFEDEILRVIA